MQQVVELHGQFLGTRVFLMKDYFNYTCCLHVVRMRLYSTDF